MSEEYVDFEEALIEKTDIMECLQKLAPEVQNMIISVYGSLENYHAAIQNKEFVGEIFYGISELTWREQEAIFLRFGLADGRQRTLDEVASIMGATRERIRVIQCKFLRKIGGCRRRRKLPPDFLE